MVNLEGKEQVDYYVNGSTSAFMMWIINCLFFPQISWDEYSMNQYKVEYVVCFLNGQVFFGFIPISLQSLYE